MIDTMIELGSLCHLVNFFSLILFLIMQKIIAKTIIKIIKTNENTLTIIIGTNELILLSLVCFIVTVVSNLS